MYSAHMDYHDVFLLCDILHSITSKNAQKYVMVCTILFIGNKPIINVKFYKDQNTKKDISGYS